MAWKGPGKVREAAEFPLLSSVLSLHGNRLRTDVNWVWFSEFLHYLQFSRCVSTCTMLRHNCAPCQLLVSGTSPHNATDTRSAAQPAQHIVRDAGCGTVNPEAKQKNTYFITGKICQPYGTASHCLFVQLPRDFTHNLLPKTNKYLEEISLPYAMMSINLSPNFKISMFQQLCSSF